MKNGTLDSFVIGDIHWLLAGGPILWNFGNGEGGGYLNQTLIRFVITLGLLVGVFKETGWFTTINMALILLYIELKER